MNKHVVWLGVALVAFAAGCSSSEGPSEEVVSAPVVEEGSFQESALGSPPAAVAIRASGSFDARVALSAERLAGLLGEPELVVSEAPSGALHAESARVVVEADPAEGRFLVLYKDEALAAEPPASRVEDAALEARSRELLRGLGVPEAELGRVTQTAVLAESAGENGAPGAPVVHSYKTFVERSVNGVVVLGSRFVLSYDTAGRLRRVLGTWPTLASTGHQAGTSLPLATVEARVTDRLASSGLSGRAVRTRYVYVPVANADGTVALQLHAEARVPADRSGGRASSPQAVLVALD